MPKTRCRAAVAARYDVGDEVLRLGNGDWKLMSRPAVVAYARYTARVSRETLSTAVAATPRLAALPRQDCGFARSTSEPTGRIAGTRFSLSRSGFAVFRLSPENLELEFRDFQGASVYRTSLARERVARAA